MTQSLKSGPLKIDFVSDVVCPWCAIGLHSLLQALEQLGDEVRAEEQLWLRRGVDSVPTIVFNERHAVSGGQPVETFVKVIREVAAK